MLTLKLPLVTLGLLLAFPEQTTASPVLWVELWSLWPGLGGWQANVTAKAKSLPYSPSQLVFLASFRKEDSCGFSLGNLPSFTSLV